MNRGSVLAVDDDALFRAALVRYLEAENFAVVAEGDPSAALERIEQRPFDLVITDLRMPGLDGIGFIRRVRALDPEAVCLVITGFGSPERSIEALNAGAFWFIEKSYERIVCLGPLVEKALEFRRLHGANRQLQRQLESRYGFDNIVGESEALRATIADVRVVAATNQNLQELIREKRFREDLYFRLAVVPIEVPPLRARREDIPLLARHFLEIQRRSYPDIGGVTEPALKRMVEYDWPGNVRELQGLIERVSVLRRSGWIDEGDLPAYIAGRGFERPIVSLPAGGVNFEALVCSFEEELIQQALDATGWNKNRAATLLGLKRTTLVEKIKAKGLAAPAPDVTDNRARTR